MIYEKTVLSVVVFGPGSMPLFAISDFFVGLFMGFKTAFFKETPNNHLWYKVASNCRRVDWSGRGGQKGVGADWSVAEERYCTPL